MDHLFFRAMRTRAAIATQRPNRRASGSIDTSPPVLLDVATEQGVTARSCLSGYMPIVSRSLPTLPHQFAPLLRAQPVVP
jgi:mandelate racemase